MVIKIEENNFFGIKKENNKWYVIPIKDNPTPHDYKIAEIEAKKIGVKLKEDLEIVFEVQLIKKFLTSSVNDNHYQQNYGYLFSENHKETIDPAVESVRKKLLNSTNVGIQKYGEQLANYKKYNFILEMQQEALDFANYCEVELQKEETINQLVNKYSNDTELGSQIRKIYGK